MLDYERSKKNQREAVNLFNLGAFENQPGSYGDSPCTKSCSHMDIILPLLFMRFMDAVPPFTHGSLI